MHKMEYALLCNFGEKRRMNVCVPFIYTFDVFMFSRFASQIFRKGGGVNTNSISYINSQSENVTLDPSGTDYIDYSNNAVYFHDAHGINPNDENSTSLVVQKNDSPFFLSSLAEFTWVFKYKLNSINTTSIVDQFFNNTNYDVSFSNTSLFVGETLDVHVLKASHDSITYTISGDLTSADLSNADLTGTISATETTLSYPIVSGNGQFRFILDNTDISNNATILLKYWVKTVTNWAGDVVFAFASSPSGTYYDQPDLSFNTGDVVYFDVSNTSGYNLVFGTVVDDDTTLVTSNYSETNNVITLDLTGYGSTVYYFEDSDVGMGYVDANANVYPNIMWFKMDDGDISNKTLTNHISNGYGNATLPNYGTINTSTVKYGTGSIYLDHSNTSSRQSITFPSVPLQTSFTVSFWMKMNSNSIYPTNEIWRYKNQLDWASAGLFMKIQSTGALSFYHRNANSINIIDSYPNDQNWHHICFTCQYSNINSTNNTLLDYNFNFYFDNVLKVNNGTILLHTGTSYNYHVLGGILNTGGYFDDYRFYDRALSANEVNSVYLNKVPIEHTVTVANGVFVIDGVSKPEITFTNGETYIFDQSDSTNAGFPIVFGTSPESSSLYTTGVTVVGTPGQAGAYTKLVYTGTTGALYYYSTGGSLMGYFNGYAVKTVQNWTGQDVFSIKSPDESDYIVQPDLSFNAGETALFYVGDSSMTGYNLVFGTVIDDSSTVLGAPYVSETDNVITLDLTGYSETAVYYFEDSSANMGYVDAPTPILTAPTYDVLFKDTYPNELSHPDEPRTIMYLSSNNITNKEYFGRGGYTTNSLTGSLLKNLSYYKYVDGGVTYHALIRITVGEALVKTLTFNDFYYRGNIPNNTNRTVKIRIGINTVNDVMYELTSESTTPLSLTNDFTQLFTANTTYTSTKYNDLTDTTGTSSTECELYNNTITFSTPTPIRCIYITTLLGSNMWLSYDGDTRGITVTEGIPVILSYSVTVANGVFVIDGVSKPEITFTNGETYIFDQSDPSNAGFPIVFGTSPESSSLYTTGVTVVGTPGQAGAYTKLEYNDTTGALYYYNNIIPGMGYAPNTISYNVTVADTPPKFYLNSALQVVTFTANTKYYFYQYDSTNEDYPIVFDETADDAAPYFTDDVTTVGTPGQSGAYTILDLSAGFTGPLVYFSSGATDMGFAEVYTVKVVQNWAGNNVFSIQAPGDDLFYDQPDLSFNAGDNAFFDVGDSTMSGYTLVFGTEIDNADTILGSSYVSQSGNLIQLNLPSDYTGGAVYYFEDTSANMGYVEAPEATSLISTTNTTNINPPNSSRYHSSSYTGYTSDSTYDGTSSWIADENSASKLGTADAVYMTIDCGSEIGIVGLRIQGRPSYPNHYVAKLTVEYSSDGTTYNDVDNGAEFDSSTAATPGYADFNFATPVLARYIKITPTAIQESNGFIAMRAGLIQGAITTTTTPKKSNLKIYIDAQSDNRSGTSLTNLIDTANNATNVGSVTYESNIGGRGSYYLPYGQSGVTNASIMLPDVLTSNPSNSLTSFTFSIYYYTTADTINANTRLFGDTASLTAVWGHVTNNINIGNGSSNLQFYTVNINTSAPSLNTWHHLCFTYDGTTTTLYINGVNVGTSNTTVNFIEPLLLGAYYPGTQNRGDQDQAHNVLTSYAGYYFDAVHVYDTVLTASEVTQLYNNPYVDTSSTVNVNVYTVTVSNEVFFIDTGSGAQSKPEITFTDGESYVFDQSDSTNAGYPIVFGTTKDDMSNLYTTGVTVVGSPGQPGAYTRLDYTGSTALFYFSSEAANMGYSVPQTWTLLFRQTYGYGWSVNPATNSLNESDTSNQNYSIVNSLYGTTNYKNGDFYQFKYIDKTNNETVEWKQTSNFVETNNSVTGYELISSTINPVPWNFGGLAISANSSNSYYDGNPGSNNWFYPIGQKSTTFGSIPAFASPYPGQIELWVYS